MVINKEGYLKNKIPKNSPFEQRVEWYKEHNKNCSYYPGFFKKLEKGMKKKGIKA